jgi:UDP-GlcNAc:undecaprenyl-phosphate GlcNAc-1-phosphate transferase
MGGWLLGALLVALIGLLDDRRELRPGVKLLGQTVAAFLPLLGGNVVYSIELGGATLPLGLLAAPFTLLWIVGVTNALNLTDGLDGLASGLSAIVALACIALSAQTGNGEALSLALALLGSTLGFLALNSPPARLFLGDGGSYFLGFLLAGLVLAAVQPRWGAFEGMPWVVPIALLGYPLADTLWAVIRRLRAGRSIFEPDDQHLHHGLWRALEDERKAVWALWGLTMLLAALALALFSVAGPGRS